MERGKCLITCGRCGASYVGQIVARPSGKRNVYYRCGNRGTPIHPERESRCMSKIVDALWLEQLVWNDCRTFIQDPGEALAEAQRQLQDRLAQAASMGQERGHYLDRGTSHAAASPGDVSADGPTAGCVDPHLLMANI